LVAESTSTGAATVVSAVNGPAARTVSTPDAAPEAVPAVHLAAAGRPAAISAVPVSWWDPWGNYGRCVLGIGVPVGVAWYFVVALGTRAALGALRSQPLPPWAGAGAKRYAEAVWNSCARFIAS
jgi:hypothetical protein